MANPPKKPAAPKAPAQPKAAKAKAPGKPAAKAKARTPAPPAPPPEDGKRPHGRPTVYTEKKAQEILELLAEGNTLRRICQMDGMPSYTTVYNWMDANPVFFARYQRARLIGAHAMIEETIEIADDARNDWMETQYGEIPDKEALLRSKLRVDARFKVMEKFFPRVFGNVQQHEVKGEVKHEHEVRVIKVPLKEVAVIEQRALPKPEAM